MSSAPSMVTAKHTFRHLNSKTGCTETCISEGTTQLNNIHVFCGIKERFGADIKHETARKWLYELGSSRIHHQKGVYIGEHVVRDRQAFLRTMNELDKKSMTYDGNRVNCEEGKKPLIRVVHDESTYYANCDQSVIWADEETNVSRECH